jgi:hypothetical protein
VVMLCSNGAGGLLDVMMYRGRRVGDTGDGPARVYNGKDAFARLRPLGGDEKALWVRWVPAERATAT